MGNYWILKIGNKEIFDMKSRLPFSLLVAFEEDDLRIIEKETDLESDEIFYRTSIVKAKTRMQARGISLAKIENVVVKQTGIPIKILQETRQFVASSDEYALNEYLSQKYPDRDEEDLFGMNFLYEMEYADESHTVGDFLYLYKFLVALNNASSEDQVILDVCDWIGGDTKYAPRLYGDLERDFVRESLYYRDIFSFIEEKEETIEKVRQRLCMLGERELIEKVLVPLLERMGYQSVTPVSFHGPGEHGQDIRPFYKVGDFGKRTYYTAQAKVVQVHGNTSRSEGNVQQLLRETTAAMSHPFFDPADNIEKTPNIVYLFLIGGINSEARIQLNNGLKEFDLLDRVTVLDGKEVAKEIIKYNLRLPS